MSAFICSDEHINVLINYAVNKRASYYWNPRRIDITSKNASEIGQILLDENYRSVNHRYRSEHGEPHAFKFKLSIKPYSAVDILKAINCLDYQSCETDDWSKSQAWAILDGLKDVAIRNLPGYEASNGWNL
jgi:hypothetical protein